MRKAALLLISILLTTAICFSTSGCNDKATTTEENAADTIADTLSKADSTENLIEETPMPSAADMLFDDFIFNFAGNRKLQSSRIKFPLPVNDNGHTKFMSRNQWTTDHFFMEQDYYTIICDNNDHLQLRNDTSLTHAVIEKIMFKDKQVKQYQFNRIKGKWMLTAIDKMPIENNQNASFLYFYERFAVDNEFQIESMDNEVEFTTPDPDDDFTNMTGTIVPDQWPAFRPDFIPSGDLYNIIYGNVKPDSDEKTFLIEGIANGLRYEYTFIRKNGKWLLKKFNT